MPHVDFKIRYIGAKHEASGTDAAFANEGRLKIAGVAGLKLRSGGCTSEGSSSSRLKKSRRFELIYGDN